MWGEGYWWRVLTPPAEMTKDARTYYKIKIMQKEKKLEEQKLLLERDELLSETKRMEERADALAAQVEAKRRAK